MSLLRALALGSAQIPNPARRDGYQQALVAVAVGCGLDEAAIVGTRSVLKEEPYPAYQIAMLALERTA